MNRASSHRVDRHQKKEEEKRVLVIGTHSQSGWQVPWFLSLFTVKESSTHTHKNPITLCKDNVLFKYFLFTIIIICIKSYASRG